VNSFRLAWLLWAAFGSSLLNATQYDRFHTFHHVSSAESALLEDLQDGKLDHCSLIESALIAAGHDDFAVVADLQQRFKELAHHCQSSANADDDVQAKPTLRAMHAKLQLDVFQPDLCDVGETIKQGRYNCLTATLLYQALCAEFRIDTQAEWVPAHVRCWFPDQQFAVETTSGTWRVELVRKGRLLTTAEMLGKVYYNRGVRLMRRQEFAPALVATWVSCCLDPLDDQAESNLRACLNNWALACAARGDLETAQELLKIGLTIDPNYSPFFRNQQYFLPADSIPGGIFATFD
jgi:tetratricopeptide (TPR) repeat protein